MHIMQSTRREVSRRRWKLPGFIIALAKSIPSLKAMAGWGALFASLVFIRDGWFRLVVKREDRTRYIGSQAGWDNVRWSV